MYAYPISMYLDKEKFMGSIHLENKKETMDMHALYIKQGDIPELFFLFLR